jgi:hypothetical protein
MTAAAAAAAQAVAERDRVESGAPAIGLRRTRLIADGEIKAALSAAMAEEQRLAGGPAGPRTPAGGVPVQGAAVDSDGLVDDGKRTEIMDSVDPELIAKLTGSGTDTPIVDDGKRTVAMEVAVPPADDDDGDDDDGEGDGDGSDGDGVVIEEQKPTPSGRMPAVKVKRGKRRKRR